MHKIFKNPFGTNKLQIASCTHNHNTRYTAKGNYFIPQTPTIIGKKAFSYVGPKVWQEVPPEIKLCSFPSFKFKLKKYFVNKYVTIN